MIITDVIILMTGCSDFGDASDPRLIFHRAPAPATSLWAYTLFNIYTMIIRTAAATANHADLHAIMIVLLEYWRGTWTGTGAWTWGKP